jgi:hypothetical protein
MHGTPVAHANSVGESAAVDINRYAVHGRSFFQDNMQTPQVPQTCFAIGM